MILQFIFIIDLPILKYIEMRGDTYAYIKQFVIEGLERLENAKIGCIVYARNMPKRDDGICRITNCPNLRQLEIGHSSFNYFQSFELSNLNSIRSIKFGGFCFQYADFSLKGE